MRKVFFTIVMFVSTLYAIGECQHATFIVDSDGYANVRLSADTKSDVVAKLASGTVVYAEYSNDNLKWCKISMTKGGNPIGYVHSSRIVWYHWPLKAYVQPLDNEYIDICDAPYGKIIMQLPHNGVFLVNLSDFQEGWWKIDKMVFINDRMEQVPYTVPTDVEYWIQTIYVNSDIKGDGTLSFSLLREPREGAPIVKDYPKGTLPSIQKILDLSPDKLFLKIELNDGNVGWVPSEIVCYSYFSVCTI